MQPTYRLGASIGGKLMIALAVVAAVDAAVAISLVEDSPAAPKLIETSQVVQLEPVVVTISRERFDELYAEAHPASRAVASAR